MVPLTLYVPVLFAETILSMPDLSHCTVSQSLSPLLNVTSAFWGSFISCPIMLSIYGFATASRRLGAAAPVLTYLNTFNEASGFPVKSKSAWLSTAEPPHLGLKRDEKESI